MVGVLESPYLCAGATKTSRDYCAILDADLATVVLDPSAGSHAGALVVTTVPFAQSQDLTAVGLGVRRAQGARAAQVALDVVGGVALAAVDVLDVRLALLRGAAVASKDGVRCAIRNAAEDIITLRAVCVRQIVRAE